MRKLFVIVINLWPLVNATSPSRAPIVVGGAQAFFNADSVYSHFFSIFTFCCLFMGCVWRDSRTTSNSLHHFQLYTFLFVKRNDCGIRLWAQMCAPTFNFQCAGRQWRTALAASSTSCLVGSVKLWYRMNGRCSTIPCKCRVTNRRVCLCASQPATPFL